MSKNKKIVELQITDMRFPNKGIGYLDGEPVSVKNTIKGQKVEVRMKKKKTNYEGHLISILEPSPIERVYDCPDYRTCGGCTYQSISYEDELKIKEETVLKLFDEAEIKNINYLGITPAPNTCAYRNKMEFSFGDSEKNGPLELGMRKRNSHYEVVTSRNCLIIDEDIKNLLLCTLDFFRNSEETFYHKLKHEGCLRHLVVRKAYFTDEILINLVTTSNLFKENNTRKIKDYTKELETLNLKGKIKGILHTVCDTVADAIISDETTLLYGQDFINEKLLGLDFKITPFSFFQTNSAGAENLYKIVREFVKKINPEIAFDLYSGTGTIAQIISPFAKTVYGIEIVDEAVESAKENCVLNNISNCEFIQGDVLLKVEELEVKPDLIVLDPPRSGIHPKAINKIISFDAENIIYVSCNPATLVKDLTEFINSRYEIKAFRLCDMFPRTYHVETVVLLTRKKDVDRIDIEMVVDKEDVTEKVTYKKI